MATNTIDAKHLCRRCFLQELKTLSLRKNGLMTLMFSPVPDGDTGTNMTLTIMSALRK